MSNQSRDLRLRKFGKLMKRIKENGIINEQNIGTEVTKRMQHHLRSSMPLTEDKDFGLRIITRVMAGSPCSFGLVEESIAKEIVHSIRVIDRRSIVQRKRRQWGMLDKVFHGSM